MGNCLVTKFKGRVNAFLPKIGQFEIKILPSAEGVQRGYPSFASGNRNVPIEIDIEDGADGEVRYVESNSSYYIKSPNTANFRAFVGNMGTFYGILQNNVFANNDIIYASVDIEKLTRFYSPVVLKMIQFMSISGHVYPNNNIRELLVGRNRSDVDRGSLSINLDEWTNIYSLISVNINICPNVKGNIVSLAKNINMTSLQAFRCSGISGDVKTFAQAMHDAGRASGTLSLNALETPITVDGVAYGTYTGGKNTINITFNENGYEMNVV